MFGQQLETPHRILKRVQALEKEGEQLGELPGLPADTSTGSADYSNDSPKRPAVTFQQRNNNRMLSPIRDENEDTTTTTGSASATPASRHHALSRQQQSPLSGNRASPKHFRGQLSPLRSVPVRQSPKPRSGLSRPMSGDNSSTSDEQQSMDLDHSGSDQEEQEDEEEEDEVDSNPPTTTATHTETATGPVQQDNDGEQDTQSGASAGIGLGRPSAFRSSNARTISDRIPSLTRSTSASNSPHSTLRSPTFDSHHHQDVQIHDQDTSQSDHSSESSSGRPGSHLRLPRPNAAGAISNQSSPAKPTVAMRSFSSYSSPLVGTRIGGAAAQEADTPVNSRYAASRAASTGSMSADSVSLRQQRQEADVMATPRPAGSQSDIERRKSHLLATLQLTAKRSQARAQASRAGATPFRGNRATHLSMLDESGSDLDVASSAGDGGPRENGEANVAPSVTSGYTTDSTNDLNPHADSNHSLPLGDRSTRFNGTKLNSYLHSLNTQLTSENQVLAKTVHQRDSEIQELRQALASNRGDGDETTLSRSSLSRSRSGSHSAAASVAQGKDEEIAELRQQVLHLQQRAQDDSEDAQGHSSHDIESLQKEVFDLKDKLKTLTDAGDEQLLALEEKDKELDALRADFGDKSRQLRDEGVALVEELEERLDEAEQKLEQGQQERQTLTERMEQLQSEVVGVKQERDRFAQMLDEGDQSTIEGHSARVQALEADLSRLRGDLNKRDQESRQLRDDKAQLERQIDELEDNEMGVKQLLNLRETELDVLRQRLDKTLEDNKAIERSLRAQVERLHREASNHEVQQQVPVDSAARSDLKDLEISNLAQAKTDLETRVSALRQHIEVLTATNDAADKTMPYKPIIGVPTPKTPGFFRATNLSSSIGPDMTGVPQQQIDSLEKQVRQLRQQLENANDELDDKIARLSRSCQENLDTAKQLAIAKARLDKAPTANAHRNEQDVRALQGSKDEVVKLEEELSRARKQIRALSSSASGGLATSPTGTGHGQAVEVRLQQANDRLREMEHERDDLLAGIAGLHGDLQRVRKDAIDLGKDIASVQGTSGTTINRSLSAQEAHTLLALVRYLKARVIRENGLRLDLAYQKTYLLRMVSQKTVLLNTLSGVLQKFKLPSVELLSEQTKKPSVNNAAHRRWSKACIATMAIARMTVGRRKWQRQVAEKSALQQAHATVRGRVVS